jgi:hypothetical protein
MRKVATLVTLLGLACASDAQAQLHWDVGVHGGVTKRFLTDRRCIQKTTCRDANMGPIIGGQGHIALNRFVRVGGYAQFEISPLDGAPSSSRSMLALGLQGKLISPWPTRAWRLWLTLGVGYVAVWAPSYTITLFPDPDPQGLGSYPATVDPSGGGFLEVPLGVGVSYRVYKPVVVYAELLGRFGGGFWGTLYGENGGRNATSPLLGRSTIPPAGNDLFSLGLVAGVGFDI